MSVQKQKKTVNIDVILSNAKKLSESETKKVTDYLESIRYAEKRPPGPVIKVKLKRAVGGDEEKLKMLFKAPEPNELKDRAAKTEQISATQQFQSLRDMLKLSEDASVQETIEAVAEKADCSVEEAEKLVAALRDRKSAPDAYKTMITVMTKAPVEEAEKQDESLLNLDEAFPELDKKIIVEGKGDGDLSGRVDTEKMFKPEAAEQPEVADEEDIPLPEDDRVTTVMPAPEAEPEVEQPLEQVPLRSVEDMAQEAEPSGVTTAMEAPVVEEKVIIEGDGVPDTVRTSEIRAVGDIVDIVQAAEKVKDVLLIKGSKLDDVKKQLPEAGREVIEEGLKLYASALIRDHGLSKDKTKERIIHKGVNPIDADATLAVMDDEGIDRSSRISGIPVTSEDVVELREPLTSRPPPQAPPRIKKKEEADEAEKEEKVEEKDEAEEIEPPKDEKPEKPHAKEPTDEVEAVQMIDDSEEKDEIPLPEDDGKEHGPLSTAETRLSSVPGADLEDEMKDAVHEADLTDALDKAAAKKEDEKDGEESTSEISVLDGIDIDFESDVQAPPIPPPPKKPAEPSSKPPPVPGRKRVSQPAPVPALKQTVRSGHTPPPRRILTVSELTTQYQMDEYWSPQISDQIGKGQNVDVMKGYLIAKGVDSAKLAEKINDGAIVYTILSLQAGKTKKQILFALKKSGFDRKQRKNIYESPQVKEEIRRMQANGAQKAIPQVKKKLSGRAKKVAKEARKLMRKEGLSKELARQRLEGFYSQGIVNEAMNSDIVNNPPSPIAKLKKWGLITSIPLVLGGTGAALNYTGTFKKWFGKDKQEQVQPVKDVETQEPAKDTKMPVEEKTEPVEEKTEPVEEKTEPVKSGEPMVETQPKPEGKVLDNGTTIEKPLVDKPKKKSGGAGATDDLDKILGGF